MPGFPFFDALRDRVVDYLGVPEYLGIQLLLAFPIRADRNDMSAGFHPARFHQRALATGGGDEDVGLLDRRLLRVCQDHRDTELAFDICLEGGERLRVSAPGMDLFDLHHQADGADLHPRLVAGAYAGDFFRVLSRQRLDRNGARGSRSEAGEQAAIHHTDQRAAPGIEQQDAPHAVGHAMRGRVIEEAAGRGLHRDDFIGLAVTDLEVNLSARLRQMYAYVIGLYHLPSTEGLVGLLHRSDDLLHGYQSADFCFVKQQSFHLQTSLFF
ncbi:hypothetical protein D9M71_509420 [compost metagenome]